MINLLKNTCNTFIIKNEYKIKNSIRIIMYVVGEDLKYRILQTAL